MVPDKTLLRGHNKFLSVLQTADYLPQIMTTQGTAISVNKTSFAWYLKVPKPFTISSKENKTTKQKKQNNLPLLSNTAIKCLVGCGGLGLLSSNVT